MSKLQSYRAVLLREIDPDVLSWDYRIANLPQAEETNAAGLVKCLSLVSSDAKQEVVLRLERVPSNRVTRREPLDRLLLISLADFRLRWPAKSPEDRSQVATGRENGDYITKLLTTGIKLNGTHYHFFGHSNSQLKSRSCFMYAASKENISVNIEAMGDLSKLKSVGKKAKRIGLLFSSADMALSSGTIIYLQMDAVSSLLNSRGVWSKIGTSSSVVDVIFQQCSRSGTEGTRVS
jgi:hypothetical protein